MAYYKKIAERLVKRWEDKKDEEAPPFSVEIAQAYLDLRAKLEEPTEKMLFAAQQVDLMLPGYNRVNLRDEAIVALYKAMIAEALDA